MMRKTICLLALALLCLATFGTLSTFTAPHARANTLVPNSCTYWATDTESAFNYTDTNPSHKRATYHWDISMLSFRACGTGQYLGKVSDHVCLTAPSASGWVGLDLFNVWYTNGNEIGFHENYFTINYSQSSTTYCSYSGSWAVSSGSSATVIAYTQALDSTDPTGSHYVNDVNVH